MSAHNIHPVHEVNDGVFNSASGRLVSLINPEPAQVCLYDMAKGLGNICRFGGQINTFQSVARHTLLVWYLAPARLKKVALLHDASEAYLGFIVKPFKVLLERVYSPFEDAFTALIFEKYKVDIALLPEIKPYDIAALDIEHRYHRENDRYYLYQVQALNQLVPGENPFEQLHGLLRKEFGEYDF